MMPGGLERGIEQRRAELRGFPRKRKRDDVEECKVTEHVMETASERHVRAMVKSIILAPASASEVDRLAVLRRDVQKCAGSALSTPGISCPEIVLHAPRLDLRPGSRKHKQVKPIMTWPHGSHCAACWMLMHAPDLEVQRPSGAFYHISLPNEMDSELFQMLAMLDKHRFDDDWISGSGRGICVRARSPRFELWRDVFLAMPLVGQRLQHLMIGHNSTSMPLLCSIVRHAPDSLQSLHVSLFSMMSERRANEPIDRTPLLEAIADHLETRADSNPLDLSVSIPREEWQGNLCPSGELLDRLGRLIARRCKGFRANGYWSPGEPWVVCPEPLDGTAGVALTSLELDRVAGPQLSLICQWLRHPNALRLKLRGSLSSSQVEMDRFASALSGVTLEWLGLDDYDSCDLWLSIKKLPVPPIIRGLAVDLCFQGTIDALVDSGVLKSVRYLALPCLSKSFNCESLVNCIVDAGTLTVLNLHNFLACSMRWRYKDADCGCGEFLSAVLSRHSIDCLNICTPSKYFALKAQARTALLQALRQSSAANGPPRLTAMAKDALCGNCPPRRLEDEYLEFRSRTQVTNLLTKQRRTADQRRAIWRVVCFTVAFCRANTGHPFVGSVRHIATLFKPNGPFFSFNRLK